MPPLQLTVVAPVPAPTLPSAKSSVRAGGSRVTELAIGRETAPVFVAAAEQIEQDGSRHDRHARAAHGEAAALLAQPGLHARGGVEPESRAAGQRDGVDAFDRLRRIEQRGFARARAAAAHIDRGHRGLVENDGGRAGTEADIFGVADLKPGHVGDQVAHGAS